MLDVPAQTDALLDRLQRAAFGYFLENFNPANGLVADTSRPGSPVSIAVVGFALSCYPVAVERGWMTREEAARRTLAVLRFFSTSEQGKGHGATGYKGFYYHFLDIHAGKPGTEFVLVCAQRSRTPRREDVATLFETEGPWPQLPAQALLLLNRDAVELKVQRGVRDEPETIAVSKVQELAEQLRTKLGEQFEFFAGVAFSHQ